MPELPKIPSNYTWAIAMNYPIGAKVGFPPSAMRVDPDRYCWIDPFAKPASTSQDRDGGIVYDEAVLMLERVEGGFKLDLTAEIPIRTRDYLRPFDIGAKPEPKNGVEWIPVVAIVAPPPPPPGS